MVLLQIYIIAAYILHVLFDANERFMTKGYLFIFQLLFLSLSLRAYPPTDSLKTRLPSNPVWHNASWEEGKYYEPGGVRRWEELDAAMREVANYSIDWEAERAWEDSTRSPSMTEEMKRYVQRARGVLQTVRDNALYTSLLDPTSQIEMPIAVKRQVGSQQYEVAIDSIVVTPTHTYMVAYMRIVNPADSTELYFIGRDIRISKQGGIYNAKLELAADYSIPIAGKKGRLTLKKAGTYATFDCTGFQELSIDAEVEFSRTWLLAEKPDGTIDPTRRVKGFFKTTVTQWSDLVASINFDGPFQLTELPDFSFRVRNAVFDFSDIQTPPQVQFPEGYLLQGTDKNLWRGIYINLAEVKLPGKFETADSLPSGERITVSIEGLLIDNYGIFR